MRQKPSSGLEINILKKEIEFSQVVTRGGDKGETSLYDGSRLRKDDHIFEALGDIDELVYHLGIGYQFNKQLFKRIQSKLMLISSLFATPKTSQQFNSLMKLSEKDILFLEQSMTTLMKGMIIEPKFYFPNNDTAYLDIARTIARRCERRVVSLIRENNMFHLYDSQKYLNRLSDFLWIYARHIGAKNDKKERN